jgi:hypothetical protein
MAQNTHAQTLEIEPLGTIAKSSSALCKLTDSQRLRKERYSVQSVVRNMLIKEGKKKFPKCPTKYHRTSLCKHALTGSEVALLLSTVHGKAFYDGLQTCGSVHVCPVCAAKIQERRRPEIAKAIDYFYSISYQSVMVTFTFPHKSNMGLKQLLGQQAKAFTCFRAGRRWDKFKKECGFAGLIRSLEVTYGKINGWHPHTHELWFVPCETDVTLFTMVVKKQWLDACIKAGLVDKSNPTQLKDFDAHSVDIKFNCKASDYLAKIDSQDKLAWGVDRELAKSSSKKGRESGMSPFQLADALHHALFIEYVDAIKGKAQLFWSHGLKAQVGIDEKTDEELAEEKTDIAELVTMLTKQEWYAVRAKELRSELLDCAENLKSEKEVRAFILQVLTESVVECPVPS